MSAGPLDTPPPPAPPPPRRRHRWLPRVLAALGVLLLVLVGAVFWVFQTEHGARFVLDRSLTAVGEGSRLEGVQGKLGGVLRIELIEVSRPDLYIRVDGFEMDTPPMDVLRGRLQVNRVAARSVEVKTASTGETAKIPVSFKPPYPVRIDEARLGELRHGTLTPEARAEMDVAKRRQIIARTRDKDLVVRDIFLRGEGGPHEWTVRQAAATTEYGKAGLTGKLGTSPPFALAMTLEAAGTAAQRPYEAKARLKGTLKAFEADMDGVVSGQPARVRAKVEPFEKMPLRHAEVHAAGLDLSRHGAGPRTQLTIDASLTSQGQAFAGPVRISNAAAGPWDRQQVPVTGLEARVVVTAERLDIHDLVLALSGGATARGKATVQKGGVQADLHVADLDLAALHTGLQKTKVTGRINASGSREAQRFEVALKDPRFQVDGRGALANQRLEVETVQVRTGGGSVAGKGTLALEGRREFRFEGRAEHFDPSAFVKTTAADLNFTFATSGTLEPLAGEARVDLAPSRYAGQPAQGRIVAAGDRSRIANADVQLVVGDARVTARGSFGRAGDAMDVTLRAPNLSMLAKPFGVAASGGLDADARLTGTFQSPAGRVNLTGANLALPSDVYVREITLRAEAGVAPDSPIDATVNARGVALGKDTPPTPFAEAIAATLKGTRAAHRLEANATMAKDTTVRVALQGGLDPRAKEPAWDGRIESLAMTGRGAFALASPAPLHASAQRIELGDAMLRGEWGEARLQTTRWTPRTLDFRGGSSGIQIQNLARSLRVQGVPRSNLVIAGDWDIHAAESFNGKLNVRRVSGDLRVGTPPLPVGLQELVVNAEVVQGRARATALLAGERIGKLQGEGTGQIVRGRTGWEFAPNAPVNARIVADHSNLEVLAPWLGEDARLGGRLNAVVTVSGTGADPQVAGQARVQDLTLREPQTGFHVERGQVALRMTGKSVVIEQFTAATPWRIPDRARARLEGMTIPEAGTITAEGGIDLAARTGSIRVRASQVPLTQIETRFLAISGEARLEAGKQGLLATGNLKADGGWIGALESAGPSLSEDVVVVRARAPEPRPQQAAGGERIRLDVRVSLGERLYFEGRGLDTRLAGELHVVGEPGAGLRATGIIRTVGGTYKGYGQNLTIERGALQFSGPVDNPQLNVLAVRKGLAVEPGVEVLGTAARPRVRLVSTPDVPEPEKLSWLVLGRGPSELAPGDASVLLTAAASMLGGNNPGSDLGKKLGFDEVKIGRSDANSVLGVLPQSTVAGRTGTASASEVVSIGRKLTKDVHLTYEQGLADAEGALRITWRISQRFQLLVRAGFLPGLDAVYRWSFP